MLWSRRDPDAETTDKGPGPGGYVLWRSRRHEATRARRGVGAGRPSARGPAGGGRGCWLGQSSGLGGAQVAALEHKLQQLQRRSTSCSGGAQVDLEEQKLQVLRPVSQHRGDAPAATRLAPSGCPSHPPSTDIQMAQPRIGSWPAAPRCLVLPSASRPTGRAHWPASESWPPLAVHCGSRVTGPNSPRFEDEADSVWRPAAPTKLPRTIAGCRPDDRHRSPLDFSAALGDSGPASLAVACGPGPQATLKI
jgi:hypothetical protein